MEVNANEVKQGSNLEFNCKSLKVISSIKTASPSFPSSLEVPKCKKLKRIQVVEISFDTH